jgi:hypothetical protein
MARASKEELLENGEAVTVIAEERGDVFLFGANPDEVAKAAKRIKDEISGFCGIIPYESGNIVITTSIESAIRRIENQIRNFSTERKYTLTEKGVLSIESIVDHTQLYNSLLAEQNATTKGKISIRNLLSWAPPTIEDVLQGISNQEARSHITTLRGTYILKFPRRLPENACEETRDTWERICREESKDHPERSIEHDDSRYLALKKTSKLAKTFTIAYVEIETSDRSSCMDCGVNTLEKNNYYMLNDEIWKKIHPIDMGMLCIPCAERRLGRKLNASDFTDAPINALMARVCGALNDRLTNRVNGFSGERKRQSTAN